jgi:site-specific DNA-methyltransferase (cytosine-N4-specific)
MSPTEWPKANNKHVLREYSESMQQLLRKKKYNSGNRPSQHNIGSASFLTNNGGAIPSNVITLANTESSSDYLKYCRARNLQLHPARMPLGLPEFFVKMLTHKNDLVVDPFAGSNTTGAAAEALGRRWLAVEANRTYITGSRGRFPELATADHGPTLPAALGS